MSGVVIANPFGPSTPPAPLAAPPNPFSSLVQPVSSAMVAPYGVPAFQIPVAEDPYLAGMTARQDPSIIDAQFTEVPPSPLQGAIPTQTVLAPQMPTPAPATLSPDAMLTEADLTAEYIKLRDAKKDMMDRHTDELAPLKDRMETIEATMLARLNTSGVESVRTTMGTAFKKLTTRYNVEDGETFMAWVQANGQQELLSRSVKPDAIREYLDTTGTLPPGIGVFSQWAVQFRK